MKHMKKVMPILLALLLMFTLIACGKNKAENDPKRSDEEMQQPEITGKIELIEEEKQKEPASETQEPSEETKEPAAEETEQPEEGKQEPEQEPEKEPEKDPEKDPEKEPEKQPEQERAFEIGKVEGTTYKNSYIGIGCTLESGWEIMTKEELLELNELSVGAIDDEAIQAAMKEAEVFYDFYAQAEDGMSNINIVFEKLNPENGELLSEEAYVDASVTGMTQALPAAGFSNVNVEKTNDIFAGAQHFGMRITGSVQGIAVYQRVIVIRKGDYAVCIAISTFLEDTTDAVAAKFFKI